MLPDTIPLHGGTFKDARDIAQADVKFLCVLLVCSDHPACNTATLNMMLGGGRAGSNKDSGDGELRDLISRRCILWAADVDSDEGDSVSASCSPAAFPYFAVTFKSQVLMEIQGNFTPSALREAITTCMADAEAEVAKEIAFAADRAARRAEQDAHSAQMQAVMDEDRRREQARRDAEEKKRREEQEEHDRLQRLLSEADERARAGERLKLEAEQRKALAMSNVPPEPPADAPADEVTMIRLTMLDGKTVTRKFLRSTPLSGLYCWADSFPEYDGSVDYELVAGFPPAAVERADDVKLGERKVLIPRCVVTMKKK